jgi:hypothetical protein
MRTRILAATLILLALWAVRPAAVTLYRGLREGKSNGAFVFSVVLAAGEQVLSAGQTPDRRCSR